MPSLIPVPLRSGLAYEPLEPDATELLQPIPRCDDAHERTAKRRRIECIATRYLAGKRPIILSAGLRGPFNKNWTNPWGISPGEEKGGLRMDGGDLDGDNELAKDRGNVRSQEEDAYSPYESDLRSKTVAQDPDPFCVGLIKPRVGAPRNGASGPRRANSPISQNKDSSTHKGRNRGLQVKEHSNQYWLKRRSKNTQREVSNKFDWGPKSSPTPSGIHHRSSTPGKRRSAPQHPYKRHMNVSGARMTDSHIASSPGTGIRGTEKSRASTHLVMNSSRSQASHAFPTNDCNVLEENTTPRPLLSEDKEIHYRRESDGQAVASEHLAVDSIRRTKSSTAKHQAPYPTNFSPGMGPRSDHTARATIISQINPQSSPTTVSVQREGREDPTYGSGLDSDAEETIVQNPLDRRALVESISRRVSRKPTSTPEEAARPPSPEEAQRLSQQIKSGVNKTATNSLPIRSSQETSKTPAPIRTHMHIASPARASSTGFAYRKTRDIGPTTKSDPTRGKPRSASVETSPTLLAESNGIASQGPQGTISHTNESESKSPECLPGSMDQADHEQVVLDADPEPVDTSCYLEYEENQSSSRLSNFSTQAAMALAHLEFQEDYNHSSTPGVAITLEDNVEEGTPRRVLDHSAAITPFHVINEEVSKPVNMATISPDRHMSTQDLFRTASPFAFSTVKKKPRRSGLRFAIITEEGDSFTNREYGSPTMELATGSPGKNTSMWSLKQTPTGNRPPLKDKNGRGGLRRSSSQTDRASVLPCQDASPGSKQMASSCLDIDLDTGLEYADRFLKSVGGGIDLLQL